MSPDYSSASTLTFITITHHHHPEPPPVKLSRYCHKYRQMSHSAAISQHQTMFQQQTLTQKWWHHITANDQLLLRVFWEPNVCVCVRVCVCDQVSFVHWSMTINYQRFYKPGTQSVSVSLTLRYSSWLESLETVVQDYLVSLKIQSKQIVFLILALLITNPQ